MSTTQRPAGPVPVSTPKPVPRRPTLVRKRDDDEGAPPSSPTKRPKVTFDTDVEVHVMEEWEMAPALVQEEVRRAFTNRALGDSSGYEKLKDVYSTKKDQEEELNSNTLKSYTIALLADVSTLNKSNADLVHVVLRSEWLGRQEDYITVYVRLLANIVSAHGVFLGEAMRMLVSNLTAGKRKYSAYNWPRLIVW